MLTARAENHFRETPDIDDTIARLQAFERAGADVLYAPGLRTLPKLSFADLAGAGAQRVSVGASLAFVAVAAMASAAEAIRDEGDFGATRMTPKLGEWLAGLD